MERTTSVPRYVIVSPVKDEERYVELTLRSVTTQTVKPVLWVIVDDGSTDRTVEIIRGYADAHPFIRLVHHPNAGARQPGSAVINAFNYGRTFLGDSRYDCIVKLDCDLSFEPEYFEKLLASFVDNPQLGIASGIYLETDKAGSWRPVVMPFYHAFGACKVVRRDCFEDIGGFPVTAGWDTVDEIRAWHRGWHTTHLEALEVKHHKREGSGIGPLRTSRMHGEIYYLTGGDPLFFAFKVLHRLTTTPVVINAAALTLGYAAALLQGKPRLVTGPEAQSYRRRLRQRLVARFKSPVAMNPVHSGQ
jgi:biofilm PGA synthesis N-glycosyltransferase PgaC